MYPYGCTRAITSGLVSDHGGVVVLLSATGHHIATSAWYQNNVLRLGSGGTTYSYQRE